MVQELSDFKHLRLVLITNGQAKDEIPARIAAARDILSFSKGSLESPNLKTKIHTDCSTKKSIRVEERKERSFQSFSLWRFLPNAYPTHYPTGESQMFAPLFARISALVWLFVVQSFTIRIDISLLAILCNG